MRRQDAASCHRPLAPAAEQREVQAKGDRGALSPSAGESSGIAFGLRGKPLLFAVEEGGGVGAFGAAGFVVDDPAAAVGIDEGAVDDHVAPPAMRIAAGSDTQAVFVACLALRPQQPAAALVLDGAL